MNIDALNKGIEKFWKPRLINYIFGKRLCQKCAKKEWKKEDKNQSFTMLIGICEKCKKGGLVAYIEKP
jgi:hypothetical protein